MANSIVNLNKVLVIDDDIFVLGVSEVILHDEGFEVMTATNPVSAIEKIKSDHKNIDIIITDYTMPQISGIELVKILREFEATNGFSFIPVILCSGHDEKAFKEHAIENSIAEVLVKPVSKELLITTVRQTLNGKLTSNRYT